MPSTSIAQMLWQARLPMCTGSSELWQLTSISTVKPVLSGQLEIDKAKDLMENGSLMKVKSIAECPLGAFCNTF